MHSRTSPFWWSLCCDIWLLAIFDRWVCIVGLLITKQIRSWSLLWARIRLEQGGILFSLVINKSMRVEEFSCTRVGSLMTFVKALTSSTVKSSARCVFSSKGLYSSRRPKPYFNYYHYTKWDMHQEKKENYSHSALAGGTRQKKSPCHFFAVKTSKSVVIRVKKWTSSHWNVLFASNIIPPCLLSKRFKK